MDEPMASSQFEPVDPEGLQEFSVTFTDRALNHLSMAFREVMLDLSTTLKEVYGAHSAVIVPGGGTYAMEAVARQFASQKHCLVLRNGWFSYRWTQIFEKSDIPAETSVLKAYRRDDSAQAPFAPAPIEDVETYIHDTRPEVVFAPHVETASGILLPEDYLRRVAAAVRDAGGLFVLDGVASGTLWVDMRDIGVDVLISAPQKGWTGTPCAGLVMLGQRARTLIEETTSSSFALDFLKWLEIMEAYEAGADAYHTTLPTDGLRRLRDAMMESEAIGFESLRSAQNELGRRARAILAAKGFRSVAASGFQSPCVIVSYTRDTDIVKRFADTGTQVTTGVPLMCGEPDDYCAFRIGLFGLDKLTDIEDTVARLEHAIDQAMRAD
jgi:aspartate aminotransferase-like enzyme